MQRFAISRSIGDYTKLLIDDTARKFTVASGNSPLSGNPDILDFSQAVSCDLCIDPFRTEKKQTIDGKQVSYQPPRYEYSYTMYATIRVAGNPYFDEMKINIGNGPISTGGQSMDSSVMNPDWNVQFNLSSPLNTGVEKYYKCLDYGNQMKKAIEEMRLQSFISAQVQEMSATSAPPMQETPADPVPPMQATPSDPVIQPSQVQDTVSPPVQNEVPSRKRWFCPECGTPNEGKFCINCGTKHPYL